MTLPNRPALSCFGSGGQPGDHPSAHSHRRQSPRDPGWSKVTFDDQFSKAVEGEASWKTSDFDQAADRYAIDFSRGVATSWSTPWS